MVDLKALIYFMLHWLQILACLLKTKLMSNTAKDLEILALRSQLALVQKDIQAGKMPKPRFKPASRCLWVLLAKFFPAWQAFLNNHRPGIWAMDFLVMPTLCFRMLYVLLIVSHDRRKIEHFAVTTNPSAAWVAQQIREATPYGQTPPVFNP